MTDLKTERSDRFEMRFVDLTQHRELRGISVGLDIQNGNAEVLVTGVMSGGKMIILERIAEPAPVETFHAWHLHDAAIPDVSPAVAEVDAARDRVQAAKRAKVEYTLGVQSGEIKPDVARKTELEVEFMKATAALLRTRCPKTEADETSAPVPTYDVHSEDSSASWSEIASDILGPCVEIGEDARTLTVTADPRTIATLASVITSAIHGA